MAFERTVEYKGATITIDRPRPSKDWYILVQLPDGSFGYDGWWPDSAYKKPSEAIAEAKAGAWLDKAPTPRGGE